jgi:hypothetical protein
MSRPRSRVCLQEGLSLNLSWLARCGFVQYGAATPERQLRWYRSDVLVAAGLVGADMSAGNIGWMQIWIGAFNQRIRLVARPRHFGGSQWYFVCPATDRHASVVWKPSGAKLFCSRHAWDGKVAYLTQFGSWIDRAHLGKEKIRSKLIGALDPDEWMLPPPPKGMHNKTYERLVRRFDRYQAALDDGLINLAKQYVSKD